MFDRYATASFLKFAGGAIQGSGVPRDSACESNYSLPPRDIQVVTFGSEDAYSASALIVFRIQVLRLNAFIRSLSE